LVGFWPGPAPAEAGLKTQQRPAERTAPGPEVGQARRTTPASSPPCVLAPASSPACVLTPPQPSSDPTRRSRWTQSRPCIGSLLLEDEQPHALVGRGGVPPGGLDVAERSVHLRHGEREHRARARCAGGNRSVE